MAKEKSRRVFMAGIAGALGWAGSESVRTVEDHLNDEDETRRIEIGRSTGFNVEANSGGYIELEYASGKVEGDYSVEYRIWQDDPSHLGRENTDLRKTGSLDGVDRYLIEDEAIVIDIEQEVEGRYVMAEIDEI